MLWKKNALAAKEMNCNNDRYCFSKRLHWNSFRSMAHCLAKLYNDHSGNNVEDGP